MRLCQLSEYFGKNETFYALLSKSVARIDKCVIIAGEGDECVSLLGNGETRALRRDVIRLSLPAIGEQMLIMLVGNISLIFVGQLGDAVVSAVGLVGQIVVVIQSVFASLSTGCTVVVARLTGEQEHIKARLAVLQTIVLALASALLVTALCLLFSGQLLSLFLRTDDAAVLEAARTYFGITIFSFPFLIMNIVIGGAFRGVGDTITPMVISGFTNIVNIFMSGMFIYGWFGVPAIGIVGAAWAVVAARAVGTALMLWLMLSGKGRLSLRELLRGGVKVDMGIIKRIMRVGLPASLEQVVLQSGFLIMGITVVSIGAVEGAVYQITNNVNNLAMMPVYGFSIAATTLVGQALGAKEPVRARRLSAQSLGISVITLAVCSALMIVFARPILSLYSDSEQTLSMSVNTLRVMSLSAIPLAILNVISAVLRGAGDIRYVMFTGIAGVWIMRYLLAQLFIHLGFGIMGVYFAMAVDYIVRATLYFIRYRKGKWVNIQV